MPSSYDDEEFKRHHEATQNLVEELARSTTDELPSKLRVALERGLEKRLPALLTEFQTSKEADIERLCQRHYNGYLDSVQQLVYMRDDCREVRTAMADLNRKLQARGAAVVQAAKRQRKLQLARQQLQQQAATLRDCRALVALAQRAASQVAAKRYVAAMHSLAAIEAQVSDPLSMPDRAASSSTSSALAYPLNATSRAQPFGSSSNGSGIGAETVQQQQLELEEDQEHLQRRALAETPLAKSLRAWLPGAQRAALQDTKRGLAEWLAVARPRARRMGATLRSRVQCLEASELTHLAGTWMDSSSSSSNRQHGDNKGMNKSKVGNSGSNTETVALLAALSEVEATTREVLAAATSADAQSAAAAGINPRALPSPDDDRKEADTNSATSPTESALPSTPSDLSAAVAAGKQAMAVLRTARVAALEASLGLAAWDHLGHTEPCLRDLLAHAALPRHTWPVASASLESSVDQKVQPGVGGKDQSSDGSATTTSEEGHSEVEATAATLPPLTSSEVVLLEHSKAGAAAVMAEVRRSLAPLDQAVAVHAAKGPKPLAEFRAQYEALRAPHFSPKQLLELHRAQDAPTYAAQRRNSQATSPDSYSGSSSSASSSGDVGELAWNEWCGSVVAWPDLVDTLGGFFAMECTLCALTSVPQATFTRQDLASLWRDATDELVELLMERFHKFDQHMHAHSLPALPRPGDRTTANAPVAVTLASGGGLASSSSSSTSSARGMVALQGDPLTGLVLLKECCLGFNASLGTRTYGFSSRPLRRALGQKLLPKFLATQLRAVQVRCARAAALDGHQPWSVSNDAEYAQWVEPLALDRLLFEDKSADQNSATRVEFPVQFSFSPAVPQVGLILHRFLAQSLAFCHGLGPDSALNGDDSDDDDDDEVDDEIGAGSNGSGDVGNGNSSGGSGGCKNRGALLRHALAEALFTVDNILNNLLTNNDSTKSESVRARSNLDASSHNSKRSILSMASSKKNSNSRSGSSSSSSSGSGNQAVSISLAAQVSLDARAYAALAHQLGALLNHALSSSGWPDARSSDNHGYHSGLAVASNASSNDFSNRENEDSQHRSGGGGGARTIANAAKSLQATADRAQDLIFELVRQKCDELLSLDAINWEPTAAPDGPRPEVEDLVAYLQVTFMCLVALPPEANAAVHFASCAYVHSNLRAALLDEGPSSSPTSASASGSNSSGSAAAASGSSTTQSPSAGTGCVRVNALALHSLRLDVLCLESFARECVLEEASGLEQVFAPLRQLLDALLDRGASHVLGNVPTRSALYPQLDCHDAETVLHKVVGVPAMARLKMMSSGGRGGAAAAELPSLDKKQATELIKLLQSSSS